jgi:hypothetical protein
MNIRDRSSNSRSCIRTEGSRYNMNILYDLLGVVGHIDRWEHSKPKTTGF